MEMVLKFSLLTIAIIVFSLSKAICYISESSFDNSKLGKLNPFFWDKHKSWRNKWKNGDYRQGEKFFGLLPDKAYKRSTLKLYLLNLKCKKEVKLQMIG